MTLDELRRIINVYLTSSVDPNSKIIITLDEPNIGARSGTPLEYIMSGFDFESGQIRLQAADKICRLGKAKDDVIPMNCFRYIYDTKTVISPHCPRCETKLQTEDEWRDK